MEKKLLKIEFFSISFFLLYLIVLIDNKMHSITAIRLFKFHLSVIFVVRLPDGELGGFPGILQSSIPFLNTLNKCFKKEIFDALSEFPLIFNHKVKRIMCNILNAILNSWGVNC